VGILSAEKFSPRYQMKSPVPVALISNAALSPFEIEVFTHIQNTGETTICAAIIEQRPSLSAFQKIIKHVRRGRGFYVVVMALASLFGRKEPFQDASTFFTCHNIPFITTRDIHSATVIEYIQDSAAETLVLLGGFGIIRQPLINVCNSGIFSYHHGDMRKYRGMPPAFWEIYYGEQEMGISVQKISEKLDAGQLLAELHIPIHPTDSVAQLQQRAYQQSTRLMAEALCVYSRDKQTHISISPGRQIYTLPNFRSWLLCNIRIGLRKLRACLFPR
jgi:folate-dependent phosphoribosylglycinamide formyltransferase PurN